jgi:WD40 repeat protein
LPPEVRDARIVSADLSPDGKTLAIATEEGNRVVLLDLSTGGRAPVVATLSVLPDVRESVISDIAFSPVGDTLWVATGDTPRSRASGPQPTQIFAARIEGAAAGALPIARTLTLPEAEAPDRLSTGRMIPLPSGSSIRLPPERATVFLTGKARPSASAADAGAPAPAAGAVYRIGAEDAASTLLEAPGRFGQPDLSPDGRWLLAAQIAADGAVRLFAARADGRPGAPRSIPMLGPTAKPAGRDHQLPSVHVQP